MKSSFIIGSHFRLHAAASASPSYCRLWTRRSYYWVLPDRIVIIVCH